MDHDADILVSPQYVVELEQSNISENNKSYSYDDSYGGKIDKIN